MDELENAFNKLVAGAELGFDPAAGCDVRGGGDIAAIRHRAAPDRL